MRSFSIALFFVSLSLLADGQLGYSPPAHSAYCLNAGRWIPINASVATPLKYTPSPVGLFGNNGSSWYGLTCDSNGNLNVSGVSATPVSMFFVDGTRTDSYTPNGSQSYPYLTPGAAIAAMTGAGPYALWIDPKANYVDAGPIVGGTAQLIIYGNNSDWTVTTGGITLNGPATVYDLNTHTGASATT